MALLDQLFRLRGAPRTGKPPVTLGALVTALPPTSVEPRGSMFPEHVDTESAPGQSAAAAPGVAAEPSPSGDAQNPPAPGGGEQPPSLPPVRPPIRSGTRFNPFVPNVDAPPVQLGGEGATSPQGLGPCLEDPTLPPLRLQAQVPRDREDRPVILGAATLPLESGSPVEFRQIEAPTVRLAPLKSPARSGETAPMRADRPLMLRLEIQAEPFLDVVAFKQHAAKFPGVVKCVISDAHD